MLPKATKMKLLFLILLISMPFFLYAQNAQYKSWSEISELTWNNLTESFTRTAEILNDPTTVTTYQLNDRFTDDAILHVNGATYRRTEFDNLINIKWKKLEIQNIAINPNRKDEFIIITNDNNYSFAYKIDNNKLLIKAINEINKDYKTNLIQNNYNVCTPISGASTKIIIENKSRESEILISPDSVGHYY